MAGGGDFYDFGVVSVCATPKTVRAKNALGGGRINYLLHLSIYLSMYEIVAMSLNLAIGSCGLLTLAYASYLAIGSYVYALITLKLGWDFLPAMLLGVVIAAVLSLAISLPAGRFRGDFFVMVSLAVQTLLFSLFYNWTSIAANLRLILYGVLLVVMMHVRPQGIAGDYRSD